MIVHVDAGSPTPVFEQLRAQIVRLVVSGQLGPGSKLPPIRQLAHDLGLARGTVAKVYDALAREGIVEASGRHGTTVVGGRGAVAGASDLDAAADTLALVTRQLGLDPQEAHRALDAALRRW